MGTLQRITFRFGLEIEVRYLPHTPDVGDFVTHGRELWVVSKLEGDPVGVTVVCDPPSPGDVHHSATNAA